MLTVIGRASSINVRKVLWTLEELGLPCARQEAPADLRALNPNAMVPVLRDGERVLWESNAICRYLAAGSALLPAEPWPRAQVEQWMDWQATDLNAAWRDAFMGLVRGAPLDAARIAESAARWNAMMLILEDRLRETGAFVAGAAFTLADVVLGLSVNRWLMTPVERPPHPAIAAYVARLGDRPGWRLHGGNGIP